MLQRDLHFAQESTLHHQGSVAQADWLAIETVSAAQMEHERRLAGRGGGMTDALQPHKLLCGDLLALAIRLQRLDALACERCEAHPPRREV